MEKISKLKNSLKNIWWVRYSYYFIRHLLSSAKSRVYVENQGCVKLYKDVIGCGNRILIGKNSFLNKTKIRIRGNNNTITFGENCTVGMGCSFWMEGNDISIKIGKGTSFTHTIHFCAQEDNISIIVGEDCLFSNTIIVRTSDSHPILDLGTKERINKAKSVVIGNHVWIAPNTKIFKGVNIGDGAIIGSDTLVTKDIPANSLAVGHPAKVVKQDVEWTHESLF